jgi:hypothetical protein
MIKIVDILRALSDDKAFILFNSIALGEGQEFTNLIKKWELPHINTTQGFLDHKSRIGQKRNG